MTGAKTEANSSGTLKMRVEIRGTRNRILLAFVVKPSVWMEATVVSKEKM